MSSASKYRTYLYDYLRCFHNIDNPKKFFTCLNPKHIDNNPSMIFTDKYHICKCFACGVSYDIFDLIELDFNITNFREKINKIGNLFNQNDYMIKDFSEEKKYQIHDYTNFYNYCKKNINKTNYLQSRGISERLIKKYNIGFDKNRNLIIFPINKNCYFGRSVNSDFKMKNKGISDIWNKQHILDNDSNSIVFVTEGIIDSLSLEEIDPNVKTISINGIGNTNSLINLVQEIQFKGTIVIVFDNDYRGVNAANNLKEELTKINVNSFSITMIKSFDDLGCKDINEALLIDRERLKKVYKYFDENIKKIISKQNEKGEEFER